MRYIPAIDSKCGKRGERGERGERTRLYEG